MADTTRNVFSLSDWRSQWVDGEGVDVSKVSIRKGGGGARTAPNVGYFMGGNRSPGGNSNSYVDKINLSSMTVSVSNPAIIYTKGIAGKSIGNATHLFYTGGEPNSVSIRDYATDTSFRMGDQSNLASGHGYGGAVSEGTTYGYYAAGNGPLFYGNGPGTNNSYVTKMNYVHGTTYDLPGTTISTTPSPANGRNYIASASNKQAGYFIGGSPSGPNQPGPSANQYPSRQIDKLSFSTDTTTLIPATTTPSPSGGSWYGAAIGEGTKIYYSGGYKGQPPGGGGDTYNTSTYKLTLATDSRSNVPGASLPERARYQATTGSSTIGHFGGGNNGPTLSWIQRLTYATDTFVHSPARLGRSGEYMGGGSAYENGLSDEKPLEGYDSWLDPAPVSTDPQYHPAFAGGGYPQYGWFAAIPGTANARVINFASGVTMPGPSYQGFDQGAGTNNETHGYIFGGTYNPGPGQRHSQVSKITFATGEYNAGQIQNVYPTQYIPQWTPNNPGQNISALSNPSLKGYFMGGGPSPGNNSKWYTMSYSSDTMNSTPSSYRNPSTPSQPQLSGSATFAKRDASGYAFAGSNYYKMDFASDSTSMKAKSGGGGGNTSFGGASNLEGTAGYWTGSSDTNFYKLDFATDTMSSVGSQANGNAAAMLTGLRGAWFWPQSNSITQRLNFSTETVDTTGYGSPSPRSYAPMSPFNSYSKAANSVPSQAPGTPGYAILQSTGYPDKGYVGTGEGTGPGPQVQSKRDKFTFSTETNNSIPGAAAGARKGEMGNTSPSAVYFSGGAHGPSPWGQARTTDRIPFSNDTPSILPSATLPDPGKVWYGGSYGNRSYGYRVKGQNYDPSYWSSTNDKITYSTNTFERMHEGAGDYAGIAISTLASLEEGYAAGGGTPGQSSYMEKFTYQTGTASLQPKSYLPLALSQAGASGTNEKGYLFAGNTPSGNINSITKFTYKTGTVEATPAQIPGGLTPGPNRLARAGAMSTGEYTYVMGGIVDDWQSNYFKFTHSTDTAQVISANLQRGRGYLEAATGSGQGENITYYKEQTNF